VTKVLGILFILIGIAGLSRAAAWDNSNDARPGTFATGALFFLLGCWVMLWRNW